MTKVRNTRRWLIALTLGAIGLLVPVSLTPGDAVQVNDACADGACCFEAGSLCEQDGKAHLNYYESSSCRRIE